MRFLWKSQLKKERGRFLPRTSPEKNKVTRKERLAPRQNRWLFYGIVVLWLAFLGTVVYLVLFSPYLVLTKWRIEGLESVSEQELRQTVTDELSRKYLGFIPRDTFFLLRSRALEQLLRERYPLIREITIRRTFPETLVFTVRERNTILKWCSADVCAQIIEDGHTVPVTAALEEEGNHAHTLTLIDESNQPLPPEEQIFERDFVSLVVGLREGLRTRFGIETEETIRVASRFAFALRLRTTEGWELSVSTRLTPEASLNALGLLIGSEIPKERLKDLEYIDLRTENRVFYRYRDGSGPAVPPVSVPQVETKEKKK